MKSCDETNCLIHEFSPLTRCSYEYLAIYYFVLTLFFEMSSKSWSFDERCPIHLMKILRWNFNVLSMLLKPTVISQDEGSGLQDELPRFRILKDSDNLFQIIALKFERRRRNY